MSEQHTRTIVLDWDGGTLFRGGAPGGPTAVIDADGHEAPSPLLTLLLAAASCSGADIVTMLPKMHVALREFRTTVRGLRHHDHPKRFVAIHFTFRLRGGGLDELKARRAIDLSIQKYCSVINSLNPDIPITYDLDLG
ncbi:MAG: OsmC family protein [Gemmatimonadales bacterium]